MAIDNDTHLKDAVTDEFTAAGYTVEHVKAVLARQERLKELKNGGGENERDMIKIHRKHLLPETLIAYRLPWGWDEDDNNYIVIRQALPQDFDEELFAHTRRLREKRYRELQANTLSRGYERDKKMMKRGEENVWSGKRRYLG